MSKRGTIVRDTRFGPGLVVVEGRQYAFPLERIWKSEVPPRAGLAVEVEFDVRGHISGLSALPQRRPDDVPRLIAFVVLCIGWFALDVADVEAGVLGHLRLNFWQVASRLEAGGALCIACLAGPLLPFFSRHRCAQLAGLLPLLFMVAVAWLIASGFPAAQFAMSMAAGAYPALLSGVLFAASGAREFLLRRAPPL
jgi:hypothetical protein